MRNVLVFLTAAFAAYLFAAFAVDMGLTETRRSRKPLGLLLIVAGAAASSVIVAVATKGKTGFDRFRCKRRAEQGINSTLVSGGFGVLTGGFAYLFSDH